MKVIGFGAFGDAGVLGIMDVRPPRLAPGEVRIRIAYTSVNPVDWKIRAGYLQGLFPHVFPIIPGWDAAGTIEEVGEGVTSFAPGDEVFAYTRLPEVRWGTYAESVAVPVGSVARKPASVTLAEAAAVPLVGLTAYQALARIAGLKSGERVLVTAGAGGVGSFAVSIASALGASVAATASAKNAAYVEERGAALVIDYTAGDTVARARGFAPGGFDVILDCVGGDTLREVVPLLAPAGRLVSIVDTPPVGRFHFVEPNGAELAALGALIDQGRVKLPSIEVRSVREAAAAHRESEERHVRGKMVLAIDF